MVRWQYEPPFGQWNIRCVQTTVAGRSQSSVHSSGHRSTRTGRIPHQIDVPATFNRIVYTQEDDQNVGRPFTENVRHQNSHFGWDRSGCWSLCQGVCQNNVLFFVLILLSKWTINSKRIDDVRIWNFELLNTGDNRNTLFLNYSWKKKKRHCGKRCGPNQRRNQNVAATQLRTAVLPTRTANTIRTTREQSRYRPSKTSTSRSILPVHGIPVNKVIKL